MIKISENIFNIAVYTGEAAYGYCAAKKKSFYGFQGHLMTDAIGVPAAMTITAAILISVSVFMIFCII